MESVSVGTRFMDYRGHSCVVVAMREGRREAVVVNAAYPGKKRFWPVTTIKRRLAAAV